MVTYYESSETVLARMKEQITDVNTNEGSAIHNSQSPVSIEIANTKLQQDEILKRVFASKAYANGYDDELKLRCDEFGITQKSGDYATTYITFNGLSRTSVGAGTVVQTETGLKYYTQDDATIATGETSVKILVKAEKIGSAYNKIANTITYLPVKINGITSITNEDDITNGYDDETMESLYNRYTIKKQTPATSGNKYHYLNWALEVTGVGNAKIISLWDKSNGLNGNGSVKVVIINSNINVADSALIKTVKEYIDPNDGDGSGQAPIGATCTVVSATGKEINVSVNLTIDTSKYTLDTVKSTITTNITEYLQNIAFKQDFVSYAKIGSLIFSSAGVTDYSNLLINDGISNIPIGDEEVAIIGNVVDPNA